jgi:hypothetical protein
VQLLMLQILTACADPQHLPSVDVGVAPPHMVKLPTCLALKPAACEAERGWFWPAAC